mmetsp:Transcript_20059/g.30750  ORF Transcript_20059/g.30750 Transcript_20059/m.30750 type:complete len:268 (+) Transcript_20059:185-988(+)
MADSNNNAGGVQPPVTNENTNNARSARNNNNNRHQRNRYVGQFDDKFHKMSFNSQTLKLTNFQKFKDKTLGVILAETEIGKPLHDDVKNGKDTWSNRPEPVKDPNDNMNKFDRKEHRETKKAYLNDSLKIATIVMAQCDDFVRAKIKQQTDYESNYGSAVWVMQALNELCSGIKGNEHPIEGDVKALRAIFNCKQYNKLLAGYHDKFREAVKTITLSGCHFKLLDNSIKAEKALDSSLSNDEAAEKVHDCLLAVIFLNNLKEKPTTL